MKFISFLLLFCFISNAFASTAAIQKFERQLDEFNYSLTVEWDQKDEAFYDKITKAFQEELKTMYEKEGLSSEDVMLILEGRIKDKKVLEAMKLKAALTKKGATPLEIMESIKKDQIYVRGASWNGSKVEWLLGGLAVVVVAILVGHSSWWSDNHVCTKYDQAEQCVDEYDCRGENCWYDGTYCSMITRCTKYERK